MLSYMKENCDFSKAILSRKEYAINFVKVMLGCFGFAFLGIGSFYGLYLGGVFTMIGNDSSAIDASIVAVMSIPLMLVSLVGGGYFFIRMLVIQVGRLRDIFLGYNIGMVATVYFVMTFIPIISLVSIALFFIPSKYFAMDSERMKGIENFTNRSKSAVSNKLVTPEDDELAKLKLEVEKEELKQKLAELKKKAS